jgi:hypothetical protein
MHLHDTRRTQVSRQCSKKMSLSSPKPRELFELILRLHRLGCRAVLALIESTEVGAARLAAPSPRDTYTGWGQSDFTTPTCRYHRRVHQVTHRWAAMLSSHGMTAKMELQVKSWVTWGKSLFRLFNDDQFCWHEVFFVFLPFAMNARPSNTLLSHV